MIKIKVSFLAYKSLVSLKVEAMRKLLSALIARVLLVALVQGEVPGQRGLTLELPLADVADVGESDHRPNGGRAICSRFFDFGGHTGDNVGLGRGLIRYFEGGLGRIILCLPILILGLLAMGEYVVDDAFYLKKARQVCYNSGATAASFGRNNEVQ